MSNEISRQCVVCGKALTKLQKKCCSHSCSATYGNRKSTGENARNWKGGESTNSEGYERLYKPEHPYACPAGYVYAHRYVIEEHIGRHIHPHEIVHHRNGDKADNCIENLICLIAIANIISSQRNV